MCRPLRIQYPNAWCHDMNRGRRGKSIVAGPIQINPGRSGKLSIGISKIYSQKSLRGRSGGSAK